jgi:succinyl-diaminopimelate desuccinylase
MKGGLAVMLALLADATAPPTSTTPPLFANLLCIFYDREEGPLAESGLLPLCRDGSLAGIDLAICLEPTDSIIHAGCVGSLQAKVTIAGRRAHSARPWQGDSAIYAALPLLDALRRFARREVRIADLPFYEVLLATQANTNSSRNVVPDRFTLNLNYRYAPGKTVEAAGAELFEFVAQHSGLSPSAVDIEIVDAAPSGAVCIDQPRLRAWQAACGLPVAAKQAWTDVAQLTSLGIPAVNFGPGETAQAHQANESLPVAALLHAYRALGALLRLPGPPQ